MEKGIFRKRAVYRQHRQMASHPWARLMGDAKALKGSIFWMKPPTAALIAGLRGKVVHAKKEPLYKAGSFRGKNYIGCLFRVVCRSLIRSRFTPLIGLILFLIKETATRWVVVSVGTGGAAFSVDFLNHLVSCQAPHLVKILPDSR